VANFCRNCGFRVGAGGAFCPQCGTRSSETAGAAQPAMPVSQPLVTPAAAPKSGSGLKILLIVCACLFALVVAAVGGLYYVGHKIKQAVVEKASSYGVDLHSDSHRDASAAISSYRVCDLLPKEDAARLLGQPIDHIENQSESCLYYGPPGLSAKLAQKDMASVLNRAHRSGDKATGPEMADSVTKLAASLDSQDATNGSAGEAPLLTVLLSKDGKAEMLALSATKALFDQVKGAGEEIPELGDRAIRLANLGLNVLKGNTVIRIVTGPVPGAKDSSIAIAREILPKI
jgi:hypothetical protein